MRNLICLVAVSCLLACAGVAMAGTATLKSYDGPGYTNATTWDTKIADYKNWTQELFYADGGMASYRNLYYSVRDKSRYMLVKFDLTAIRGYQYIVGVNSATLRLYQYATPPYDKFPMYITQLTEAWTEGASLGGYGDACDGAQFYTHNSGTVVPTGSLVDNGDGTWYIDGLATLADDPRFANKKFIRMARPSYENNDNAADSYTAAASQADLIALGATRGYYYDSAAGRLYVNKNDVPVRWYSSTADLWATPGGGNTGWLASFADPQPDPDPLRNYIGWFQWDAKDIVTNWLVNGQLNAGVKVRGGEWAENAIAAHEYTADPLARPELVIDAIIHYPGDADGDLAVTFADYQILEQHFGVTTGAQWADGDFVVDGQVTFADYQLLEQQFGKSVPEPVSLSLLAFGALALLKRARKA